VEADTVVVADLDVELEETVLACVAVAVTRLTTDGVFTGDVVVAASVFFFTMAFGEGTIFEAAPVAVVAGVVVLCFASRATTPAMSAVAPAAAAPVRRVT